MHTPEADSRGAACSAPVRLRHRLRHMDTIRIRKLKFPVFLGVYGAEQVAPRPVVADIELGLDLVPAAASDNLADTVDYDALARAVRDACGPPRRYALVERVAAEIADVCLAFDPRIEWARVTVGKPGAVVGAETVEVPLARRR